MTTSHEQDTTVAYYVKECKETRACFLTSDIPVRVPYYYIVDKFGWSHGIGYATREECQAVVDRMNGAARSNLRSSAHGCVICKTPRTGPMVCPTPECPNFGFEVDFQ